MLPTSLMALSNKAMIEQWETFAIQRRSWGADNRIWGRGNLTSWLFCLSWKYKWRSASEWCPCCAPNRPLPPFPLLILCFLATKQIVLIEGNVLRIALSLDSQQKVELSINASHSRYYVEWALSNVRYDLSTFELWSWETAEAWAFFW